MWEDTSFNVSYNIQLGPSLYRLNRGSIGQRTCVIGFEKKYPAWRVDCCKCIWKLTWIRFLQYDQTIDATARYCFHTDRINASKTLGATHKLEPNLFFEHN